MDPPISVVAQPAYRIGEQAARILTDRITNTQTQPRHIVLGTDLIVRESSLRP
ncbi:MAG: substrate-binding domain-containing protein [Stackebrandtia sp.]